MVDIVEFFSLGWVKGIISACMVIGPTIGFALQYRELLRTGHARNFSTWLCFLLLVANILRIYYWLLARFDVTLMLQSVAMVLTQLAILELCTRFRLTLPPGNADVLHRRLFDGWKHFWRWTRFSDYMQFLLILNVFVGGIAYVCTALLEWSQFAALLGTLAVSFEAVFAVPQVYRMFKQASAAGVRWEMVATWLLGDALKTAYYIYAGVPTQFLVCGLFQMATDATAMMQVIYYRAIRPRLDKAKGDAIPMEDMYE